MLPSLVAACAPDIPPALRFDGPAVVVSEADRDQHHATVAVSSAPDAFVTLVSGDKVVVARLTDGFAPAPEVPFGESGHHPQIALDGPDLLLAAVPYGPGLVGATLDPATLSGVPFRLDEGVGLQPDLDVGESGGLMVWGEPDGLGRYSFEAGDFGGGERLAPVPSTLGAAGTPAIRARDGGWLAAWAERGPSGSGLLVARLDADAEVEGAVEALASWELFEDDARPAVAVGDGGAAVAWRRESLAQAWIRIFDPDGAFVTDIALHGEGHAAGRPALAAAGSVLFAAWERSEPDGSFTIALQRFALPTGEPIGAREWVASSGIPGRPSIAARLEGFGARGVVSWEAQGEGELRRVEVRLFSVASSPDDTERP